MCFNERVKVLKYSSSSNCPFDNVGTCLKGAASNYKTIWDELGMMDLELK